jgi:cell division protein FtsW
MPETKTLKGKPVDSFFLGIILTLLIVGIVAFISASLGVWAKNETKFFGIIFNQLVLGLGGGLAAMFIMSRIHYSWLKKYSLHILIATIIAMLLVFVPHLGFAHGGARRWVAFGPVSFQPAELLKIGCIIYFGAWLSWAKARVADFRFGILPLMILLALAAALLFVQPDTKSFILILVAGTTMLFVSGVPIKYLLIVGSIGVVVLGTLVFFTPYLQSRVKTFLDPAHDQNGASYQIKQSLIAIGGGGVFGRGLGQSVQKFSYLPEPQGDSIFSVIGEEFGFVGGVVVLLLYLMFAFRGFRIAARAADQFGRLITIGTVILITFQSFLNIASITGVFPLTGVPLVFMSQGGTSLLFSLAAVGIVLNISRYQKTTI